MLLKILKFTGNYLKHYFYRIPCFLKKKTNSEKKLLKDYCNCSMNLMQPVAHIIYQKSCKPFCCYFFIIIFFFFVSVTVIKKVFLRF